MTVNGNMQVAIIIINNNNKKSTICLWKEEACITLIKNDKYKIELYKEGFVLCYPNPGLKLHCINFQT